MSSVQSLYIRLLRPQAISQSSNLLPVDWPYFPLISLYNSGQSRGQPLPLSTEELTGVLAWISVLPAKFSPTARLVRLSTALLCPGTVFLVPEISSLLHHRWDGGLGPCWSVRHSCAGPRVTSASSASSLCAPSPASGCFAARMGSPSAASASTWTTCLRQATATFAARVLEDSAVAFVQVGSEDKRAISCLLANARGGC